MPAPSPSGSGSKSPPEPLSDPEGPQKPPSAGVPPAAEGGSPLSQGRVLFVRDPSILDEIRSQQKPGRCANCGRRLEGRQRVWCGQACRQKAYEKSVLHDWDETRTTVLERDDYTCQRCGRKPLSPSRTWTVKGGGLADPGPRDSWAEVDHIVPVSEAPERQYDPENLRTLCHPCHSEATRERSKKAAAGPETTAKTAEALKPKVGTKHPERVSETGKTPKKLGEQVRADLLQNMKIEDAARKAGVHLNAAKGIWSSLLASGLVPKGTRPGEIPMPVPQAAGQQGPATAQPQTPPRPQTPAQVQVQPNYAAQPQAQAQPQPQYAPQPQSPQAQPNYLVGEVVDRPDGYPKAPDRPLGLGGLPLTVDATGFITKVYQNPKNLLWYDYFKRKHPEFDGDFADFIADCIEFFFKAQGKEVVIRTYERPA